jgi:hypothetical protein
MNKKNEMFMVIVEPGVRMTAMVNGEEKEISFHTREAAQNHLDWIREKYGADYPEAKIVTSEEYWRTA